MRVKGDLWILKQIYNSINISLVINRVLFVQLFHNYMRLLTRSKQEGEAVMSLGESRNFYQEYKSVVRCKNRYRTFLLCQLMFYNTIY